MSGQENPGPLFSAISRKVLPTASHKADPVTSKEAERTFARRRTDLFAVVNAVREKPGMTGRQIAAVLGWEDDLYRVRRRLTDGLNMKLLRRDGTVAVPGCKPESKWWPVA